VLQEAILSVVGRFSTEAGGDYLSIGSRRFDGMRGPHNVFVSPAMTITWQTDGSVTSEGFVICGIPSTSPAPTTFSSRSTTFEVMSSIPNMACVTSAGGACFTDGPGTTGNNERCTIRVLEATTLTTPVGFRCVLGARVGPFCMPQR
jgi:hypothetical protein